MRDPVAAQLDYCRALLERIIRDHRSVLHQMARTAFDRRPGTDGGNTPTEAAMYALVASDAPAYQRHVETLVRTVDQLETLRAKHNIADTHTEAALLRCDGTIDATCDTSGVKDWWDTDGRHHWLCRRCWETARKREQRGTAA